MRNYSIKVCKTLEALKIHTGPTSLRQVVEVQPGAQWPWGKGKDSVEGFLLAAQWDS